MFYGMERCILLFCTRDAILYRIISYTRRRIINLIRRRALFLLIRHKQPWEWEYVHLVGWCNWILGSMFDGWDWEMVSLYFVIQRNIYHLSCGHRPDTLPWPLPSLLPLPSPLSTLNIQHQIKLVNKLDVLYWVTFVHRGVEKAFFVQISDIYVNWSWYKNLLLHFNKWWRGQSERLSTICFLIFSINKITKRTCFLDVGHVLLVSDFNQNRFDRFIFQGDILSSRLAPATAKTHSTNVFLIYHSSNLQSPYFRGVWDRGSSSS